MTKYIISSGTSVVCELLEMEQTTAVKVTTEADKAVVFDTIGEAMLKASQVNNILGTHGYKVMPVEVNKNE